MTSNKKLSLFFFIIALFGVIALPTFSSFLRLSFFIPFLIIQYYTKSFIKCLWVSLFCGLLLDLLSYNSQFGLCAFSYVLTTWVLYRQKQYFFSHKLSTLPIMTFLFSALLTMWSWVFFFFFYRSQFFTFSLFITDGIIYPLFDSLYAFVLLQSPKAYRRVRVYVRIFFKKKLI